MYHVVETNGRVNPFARQLLFLRCCLCSFDFHKLMLISLVKENLSSKIDKTEERKNDKKTFDRYSYFTCKRHCFLIELTETSTAQKVFHHEQTVQEGYYYSGWEATRYVYSRHMLNYYFSRATYKH